MTRKAAQRPVIGSGPRERHTAALRVPEPRPGDGRNFATCLTVDENDAALAAMARAHPAMALEVMDRAHLVRLKAAGLLDGRRARDAIGRRDG
jgi:hypothetical protein